MFPVPWGMNQFNLVQTEKQGNYQIERKAGHALRKVLRVTAAVVELCPRTVIHGFLTCFWSSYET